MTGSLGWRRGARAAAIPLLLSLLAACAGPDTPERMAFTASGTAIVKGGPAENVYLFGRGGVAITRIDETRLVDGNGQPLYRSVEVYPGLHTVHFDYRHAALCLVPQTVCAMRLSRSGRLVLDAAPGHVYRVGAAYDDGRLWAWIVDENDDKVVAGDGPGGANWASGSQRFGIAQQF